MIKGLRLVLVLSIVVADVSTFTMEQVFGPVSQVDEMQPFNIRRDSPMSRMDHSSSYLDVRTSENCVFPLELIIIQDATSSFEDDLRTWQKHSWCLWRKCWTAYHPGSYVGVTSFRDKPIWSLGEPDTDYCQQFDLPLTGDFSKVVELYRTLTSTGGWRSAGKPVWSYHCNFAIPNPKLAFCSGCTRLIVVSTDAGPHFEGDGFNNYGLAPFSGVFDNRGWMSNALGNTIQRCVIWTLLFRLSLLQPEMVKENLLSTSTYADS